MKRYVLSTLILLMTTMVYAGHIDTECGYIYWDDEDSLNALHDVLGGKDKANLKQETSHLYCEQMGRISYFLYKKPIKTNMMVYNNQSDLQNRYGNSQAMPKNQIKAFYGGGTIHVNPFNLHKCTVAHEMAHAVVDSNNKNVPILQHELIAERIQRECLNGRL